MSEEKKLNDLFRIKNSNQISSNNLCQVEPYFSSDIQKENLKKINNCQENKNSSKSNLEALNINNEQFSKKENNELNLKNIYTNLINQLTSINNKIKDNNKEIEQLKNSLNILKSEKNNKKSQVVNFLSNKESLDEIYNNYIDYLKNKNKENKAKIKKITNIKPNPFENQDEDAFEILISEIKEIDLNKFIEQAINFIEDIFDNPNHQMKSSLKEIINKSYSKFNDEISSSPFIDTYSIVSNFFLRISLFLSNESHGKYSETIFNLFLRCLLKMNSINVKNDELINYMNTKYKEEKGKLKQEINLLLKKDKILNNNKLYIENQIEKIISELKFEKNNRNFDIENLNNNINKFYDFKVSSSNENIINNNLIYNSQKTSNNTNINNNNINEYKDKKIKNKEKHKATDYLKNIKKIFKEDINEYCTNSSEKFFNLYNINQSSEINKENLIKNYNKILDDNYNISINENNLNFKTSFNNYFNINEIQREKILEINDKNSNIKQNRIKFNTISNSKEKIENKNNFSKNNKKTYIKKYKTINYYDSSKNRITNKEYISPEINNKKESYNKVNIQNEKNIKLEFKDVFNNKKNLKSNYKDKKNEEFNNRPQKKKLNNYNINKKIPNNIKVNNDINKNIKFELAKKINYLEKINKNNTHNNIQIKNISEIEPNMRYTSLLTEKKEKKFKYNFFDIFQDSNKKRNNSGDNKYKNINSLNSNNLRNIILLKNTRIIKNNNNYDKFITFNQKNDYIIKTDYMNDKTKSFYKKKIKIFNKNLNFKDIKNENKSENNIHNGSYGSYKINDSFSKINKIIHEYKIKGKNINIKNNNKKKEKNNYIKHNNLFYDRNKYYHYNQLTYNNQGIIDNYTIPTSKCHLYKKEKNINNIISKEMKKNNIYFIITDTKNNTKNYNIFFNNLFRNENSNNEHSNSKLKKNEIPKNKNSEKEFNSCIKSIKKINDFNYKYRKSFLLKRSLSTTINKLLNKNIEKKSTIDYNYESIINNNLSSNNNSFNVSNSLASNEKRNVKEIISYCEKNKKCRIVKIPISNQKIRNRNSINNNDIKKNNILLKNKEKISFNKIKDKYHNLLIKFKKNQKETFCYFKLFEKEKKFNDKFNPLENCSINPENLGYCEGYISFNIYSGKIKIIPRIAKLQNSNNKINIKENELFSKINNINKSLKNQNNKIENNKINNLKDFSINIRIEDLIDVEQTNIMNNIVKIHRMLIKYIERQKSNINSNMITISQKNEKNMLNLNKLIYMREIKEINMLQSEKIKAILCNYFSFSLLFGKNNFRTEIELIFINFDQYNLWNLFINEIINVNRNHKIKFNNCNHIKGNIANGSDVNEEISNIVTKDNILNI